MENGQAEEPKMDEKTPQAGCKIENGFLTVQVSLFVPNGEFLAYGMLHKASQITAAFFQHIEREARKAAEMHNRIITPAGMPRPN